MQDVCKMYARWHPPICIIVIMNTMAIFIIIEGFIIGCWLYAAANAIMSDLGINTDSESTGHSDGDSGGHSDGGPSIFDIVWDMANDKEGAQVLYVCFTSFFVGVMRW